MISKEEFFKRCEELIPNDAIQEVQRITRRRKRAWLVVLAFAGVGLMLGLIDLIREMGSVIGSMTLEDIFFLCLTGFLSILMMAGPIAIIGGVVWLFLFVKYGSQQQQFLKRYNDVIVKCLLQDYEYYYSHTEYIDEDIYIHSPFNRIDYNTYTGEDLLAIKIPDVYGNFLDTTLMCSDLTVSNIVNPNSKSDKDYTAYIGAMGYVDFPFSFGCNLYINFNPLGLPKITLEDMQFNKKFRIYTDDELEARMILTTSFMIRLVEYSKRFPCSSIMFTRDGKMYFHLSRNLFEAQAWKSGSKYAMFESHYNDVANIMALIDEIRNNDKLFKYYD